MGTLMTRFWHLFWMVLLSYQLDHTHSSPPTSIGQSFYLPRKDILEPFSGGPTIFKTIPDECILHHLDKRNANDLTFYQNSNSFYKRIAHQTKLGFSLAGKFSLGASLSFVTENLSAESVDVAGTSINIWALKDYYEISKPCLQTLEFSEQFLKEFEELPLEIAEPSQAESWDRYDTFLEKYGSHVLSLVRRGSRVEQWTFAKLEKRYTEKDFAMSGCIKFSNVPTQAGLLGVNACSNYSKEEITKASRFEMRNKLRVFGGSAETRSLVQHQRTGAIITQFMREAETHPSEVFLEFSSIWNVLATNQQSSGASNRIRAKIIQSYYEGYLDFGCKYKTENNIVLREFYNQSYGDGSGYRLICRIPPVGCRTDADCRKGGFGVCYCYGSSCVDSREVTDSSTKIKKERFIRKEKSGSYKKGTNKSCKGKGFRCKCKKGWDVGWEQIWPQSQLESDQNDSRDQKSHWRVTEEEASEAEYPEQPAEHRKI